VDHEYMKDFIATGASDEEVAGFNDHSKIKSKSEKTKWNHKIRDMRISEMPEQAQEFLEKYIQENLPTHPPVHVWFDVFDIEEKRI